MALDLWCLCSLLCNLEVRLLHIFLAGGSLRLRQDMLFKCLFVNERKERRKVEGVFSWCFIM